MAAQQNKKLVVNLAAIVIFSLLGSYRQSVANEDAFIIDNDDLYASQSSYTTELIGFKNFPIDILYNSIKASEATIDPQIILHSWRIVQQNKGEFRGVTASLEDVTVGDLIEVTEPVETTQSYPVKQPVTWSIYPSYAMLSPSNVEESIKFVDYDPSFIAQTLSTELIDVSSFENISKDTPVKEWRNLKLNRDAALAVMNGYQLINSLSSMKPTSVSEHFSFVEHRLARLDSFSSLAKIIVTNVSIGFPIVLTKKEAEIVVPKSLDDSFDFYVILFAISVKENFDAIEDITFAVHLPEGCVAFDLFPLRFGTVVEVNEETAVPDVTIAAGEFSISFSSAFKRTFGYKVLRPTVAAYGLQESAFAWTFRDDAARQGSHRLAAIVGVPKNLDRVASALSVFARTKDTWLLEGSIASSEPRVVTLISK